MKMMIVVALALVVVASAVPVDDLRQELGRVVEPIKIVRSESSQQPDGPYSFSFETEDGTNRVEDGELKEVLDEEDKPKVVVVVRGSYSYKDNDGKLETITYYADETGYHAEGDSVPKSAPSRR